MKIGIIGAMPEEISGLLNILTNVCIEECGRRVYYTGKLLQHDVVVVLSRIGKVAAASTATTLIDRFKVQKVIFTGVAGAVSQDLKIGDVVIADSLIQHDVDASAVMNFKKFEIPLLGKIYFECDQELVSKAIDSAQDYINSHSKFSSASVCRGIVASGDRFINSLEESKRLASEIPAILAVEMEGASLAQVCYEWGIPCCVIRSISDNANHNSPIDFTTFVKDFAAPFSAGIIANLLSKI